MAGEEAVGDGGYGEFSEFGMEVRGVASLVGCMHAGQLCQYEVFSTYNLTFNPWS